MGFNEMNFFQLKMHRTSCKDLIVLLTLLVEVYKPLRIDVQV